MRIGFLQCSLLGLIIQTWALPNYAQLLDKRITVMAEQEPLIKVLSGIEAQIQAKFAFSPDQIDLQQPVTVNLESQPLRTVLNTVLSSQEISYIVHEDRATITLRKLIPRNRTDSNVEFKQPSLQFLSIQGTVSNAIDGTPLAGVNVLIKGTTNGTTTDINGHYALDASPGEILVFSFIGFQTTEIRIADQLQIDVNLQEDVKNLGEVTINAGYYTTSRYSQTGNIARLEAAEIQKQPVANPMAALIARVPGLEVTQLTGVPGGNFKVRIRGSNSIANGNDPLIIIDGVPFLSNSLSFLETSGGIFGSAGAGQGASPLNNINPADIESIEVLKDADATAIYGSRGSNGVILITTKKGTIGETKIDAFVYSGISKVPNHVNLLSLDQYLEIRNEAFRNDNIVPTASNAPDLVLWDTTRFTDWQKELIGGTANITDAQLSFSGGDKSTQFSWGTGYHHETTVFPGSNRDQRISTRLTLTNLALNQKLKTVVSANFSAINTNLLGSDLTERALTLPPNAPPLYDDEGNLSWQNWTTNFENPLAYLKRRFESQTKNLVANGIISYTILKNLEAKVNLGYTNNINQSTNLIPISSMDPANAINVENLAYFSSSVFNNWITEPQLSWQPQLGKSRFQFLIGSTFLDQRTDGLSQSASGFASEALMRNLAAATDRQVATNYYSQYRYTALFGRINYTLKDKYILNITARRDGSSRFGPEKQFATFAAVGAAWIFSEEKFFNAPWLSFGKVRGSYGTTGNDQLGDYKYLDAYTISGSGFYQSGNGLAPARLSNPNFGWETNEKLEGAIDVGLWNDRLQTSVSYYRNQSSSQLVGFPLPTTTGFNTVQGNFPATVRNTGVEITLSSINISMPSFQWSTSVNLTFPNNKLIEFPDLENFPSYANLYAVGHALSIAKVYHYTGLDAQTGFYTFEDANSDGTLDFLDRQTIKFVGQYFFGGLMNTVKYDNFQLDFLFQAVKQNGYDYLPGVPGAVERNQHSSVMDRWQIPDDGSDTHKATTTPPATASLYPSSDRAIVDASFIRLKNLAFSYAFPASKLQAARIQNLRLFLQGQNLLTFTGYDKGLDPETQNLASLPPLRTWTLGVHLTF